MVRLSAKALDLLESPSPEFIEAAVDSALNDRNKDPSADLNYILSSGDVRVVDELRKAFFDLPNALKGDAAFRVGWANAYASQNDSMLPEMKELVAEIKKHDNNPLAR